MAYYTTSTLYQKTNVQKDRFIFRIIIWMTCPLFLLDRRIEKLKIIQIRVNIFLSCTRLTEIIFLALQEEVGRLQTLHRATKQEKERGGGK